MKESVSQTKEDPGGKLYDGRDFDTWYQLLEVDLDPRTRLQAIKAIEIFGHENTESANSI